MRHITAISFVAAVTSIGCYAGVGYRASYVAPAPVYVAPTATVSVGTYEPDLVDVGGGVRVIADYHEPVFYSDSFYWRYYGGVWYRSSVHTGGWVVYNDVPYSVRRIDRPHAYVRYRPSGWTPRHQRYRDQPAVRDHREPYRDNRAYQPTVRDHREPVRDNRTYQPTVRDHREPYRQPEPPVTRDHRQPGPPVQRDHRQPEPPVTRDHRQPGPPVQRDQRQPEPPVTRDHRQPQQPVTRDQREAAPPPRREERDHRDRRPETRDHR